MKHELPDTRLSQRLLDLRVNVTTADRRPPAQHHVFPACLMVCVVEMTSEHFQESGFAMLAAVGPKAKDAHEFFKKIPMRPPHVGA